MQLTDFSELGSLRHLFRNQAFAQQSPHLAWFETPPDDAGAGSEVSAIARELHTYDAAAARQTQNAAQINIDLTGTGLVDQNLTHVAIFNAATLGDMLCYATLDDPLVVSDPEPLRFNQGGLEWIWDESLTFDLTDYSVHIILDLLFGVATVAPPSEWHVAIFDDDAATSEIALPRQAATWDDPDVVGSAHRVKNSNALTWTGFPAQTTIRSWAVFDAAAGGNMLARNNQSDSIVQSGSNATVAAGGLEIRVD